MDRSAINAKNGGLLQRFDGYFRRPLMSFFLRRVGNRADAEDLTQDVFLRLAKYQDHSHVKDVDSFVFKIASNILKDRNRKIVTRASVNIGDIDYNLVSLLTKEFMDDHSPERIIIGRDNFSEAINILSELGEMTKDIYILFRLEEMKQREIASLYGLTVKSVEKHVMRATLYLASRLKCLPE